MCGLYGFSNYSGDKIKNLSELTNSLAEQSAIRGTDATGIAFTSSGGISVLKDSKSAYRLDFKHSDDVVALIGHTRHSTQGSEKKNYNNHPFSGRCSNMKFALAHNGVLCNDKELRKSLHLPKTKIETDSYIAVQLIESKRKLSFESVKYMAEKTEGTHIITISILLCMEYKSVDNRSFIRSFREQLVNFLSWFMNVSIKHLGFSSSIFTIEIPYIIKIFCCPKNIYIR